MKVERVKLVLLLGRKRLESVGILPGSGAVILIIRTLGEYSVKHLSNKIWQH